MDFLDNLPILNGPMTMTANCRRLIDDLWTSREEVEARWNSTSIPLFLINSGADSCPIQDISVEAL